MNLLPETTLAAIPTLLSYVREVVLATFEPGDQEADDLKAQLEECVVGAHRLALREIVKHAGPARPRNTPLRPVDGPASAAALVGENWPEPFGSILRAQLALPGAVDLLRAFAAIDEGEVRDALVTVARALTR